MAGAAVTSLHRGLAELAGGVVVAPEAGAAPAGTISALVGDHPVPGRRSFAAAARISQLIAQKRGADLGIVLLSGGASSLIGAPLRGMSEADLSQLYELVLASGLDIREMNVIRKRFSLWGGGRMALALAPAPTKCFAVSDVPGDDISAIGSGPCVPDPTRAEQVNDLLTRTGLLARIPPSLRRHLQDTTRGTVPETPKATHPAFAHVTARIIANNSGALQAVADAARRSGFTAVLNEKPMVGDASAAGAQVVQSLLAVQAKAEPGSTHCVIWGGETTVTMTGTVSQGGRCQELALSAAEHLASAGERAHGISLLAAGTDGRDGPTDAAGAVVDSSTWTGVSKAGRDPAADLRGHASYAALASVDALFKPGMTGTNVMDVIIGLVRA